MQLSLNRRMCVNSETYRDLFEAISQESPDLIILDIMLNAIDGMKVGKMLESMTSFKIPIIFVSSNPVLEQKIGEVFKKDIYFLCKPIVKDLLFDKVVELIK